MGQIIVIRGMDISEIINTFFYNITSSLDDLIPVNPIDLFNASKVLKNIFY